MKCARACAFVGGDFGIEQYVRQKSFREKPLAPKVKDRMKKLQMPGQAAPRKGLIPPEGTQE